MWKKTYLCEDYMVSKEGVVLSKSGQPMKPSTNPSGYNMLVLSINGKLVGVSVHLLVARAFCQGYVPGLEVNHIDGNKKNNCAYNLEWVTPQENMRHSIDVLKQHIGINNGKSKRVCGKNLKTGETVKFPCVRDAVIYLKGDVEEPIMTRTRNGIWRAIHGNRKTYLGYEWFRPEE